MRTGVSFTVSTDDHPSSFDNPSTSSGQDRSGASRSHCRRPKRQTKARLARTNPSRKRKRPRHDGNHAPNGQIQKLRLALATPLYARRRRRPPPRRRAPAGPSTDCRRQGARGHRTNPSRRQTARQPIGHCERWQHESVWPSQRCALSGNATAWCRIARAFSSSRPTRRSSTSCTTSWDSTSSRPNMPWS